MAAVLTARTRPVPLPGPVRRLVATVAVASFGTGLTLPFTLILLHEVRGIALPVVGLLLAVPGVAGVAAVPVSGALVDRVGPRRVLRGALVLQAVGSALLAVATTPLTALPAVLLLGLGLGPTFGAQSALLSSLLPETGSQARAFAVQFTALNAALGLGGLAAAGVVDVHRPGTFEVLYLVNAGACLFQAVLLPRAGRAAHRDDGPQPSYREVLADPVFRRVVLVSLLLALTGYAALDSGLPAYARVVGHVSPSAIALVFAVNTAVIVGGQLAVLRLLRRRRRSSSLAVAALLWGVSWAVLAVVPGLSQSGRTIAVLVFGGLFGLGETFMAPALQPLVNSLASERLRGRYNALSTGAFQIAFVASPAVAAVLIGNGLGAVWLAGIVVLSGVGAVVAARLRHRLTDEQDGLPVDDPAGQGPPSDPAESLLV